MKPEDWIATPGIPLDNRGPVARPFTRFIDPADAPPILDLLHAAARHPSRPAVEDAAARLGFDALRHAVLRLAAALAAQPGGPVGILLPPSAAYVVAVFAAVAAARICVLLDETYPAERNAGIAAQTGIGLVLAGPAAQTWPGATRLDPAAFLTGPNPGDPCLPAPLGLDEPAFILCTSGSTGRPKPIVHSQRTMLHWVRNAHDSQHVTEADRALGISSPSSLGGFTALLSFTLGGASLQMFDIRAEGMRGLLETLAARPVSILRATPSVLRGLASLPGFPAAASRLRIVQVYGEPFLKTDLVALRAVLPAGCFVRSTYGSTEASGLAWFAGDPDGHDPLRVASGTLMRDTVAAILDDDGRPVQRGEAGHLVISSRYNALGEWVDGQVAAGPLEPDPADPARRIVRTGDLARCDPGGVFVVLGRSDRMLKLNGQRLEPAEIETVFRRSPHVAQVEVVMRRRAGIPSLAAFVVPRQGAPAGFEAELVAQARAALPGFMVPARILVLPAIPMLPGGKVDTLALLNLTEPQDAP